MTNHLPKSIFYIPPYTPPTPPTPYCAIQTSVSVFASFNMMEVIGNRVDSFAVVLCFPGAFGGAASQHVSHIGSVYIKKYISRMIYNDCKGLTIVD